MVPGEQDLEAAVEQITRKNIHEQSRAAAEFCALLFGTTYRPDDLESPSGSQHWKFQFTVNCSITWLGLHDDGTPRKTGYLVAQEGKRPRPAVIVVIAGSIEEGFKALGWMTYAYLLKCPKREFFVGVTGGHLYPMAHLLELIDVESEEEEV